MLAPIISEPRFYAFAIPAVIFLGLAKGGFSGVSSAATPLLALYLPPLEAAALLLPLLICQDAISVSVYWRQWSVRNLQVLLPGAVIGIILGWMLASHVSDDAIRVLVGLTALVFVANGQTVPAPEQQLDTQTLATSVRLALPSSPSTVRQEVSRLVAADIKARIGVGASVIVLKPDSLPRETHKAKRLIDRRQHVWS